jgi:hypothetical protein
MKLKDLAVNDCVIVGFSRDAARGTLTLTFIPAQKVETSRYCVSPFKSLQTPLPNSARRREREIR